MTEEMREKLIAAMERAMIDAGAQDWESGMAKATRIFEKLTDGVGRIDSKEKLRELLASSPPLSWKDQQILLFAFKNLWPLMRKLAQFLAQKATDTLPPLKGGRPPALSLDENLELLDHVATLHRKGSSMKVAQKRAAIKYGCSPRTVARMWKNRENPPEEPIKPEDVVAFLTNKD